MIRVKNDKTYLHFYEMLSLALNYFSTLIFLLLKSIILLQVIECQNSPTEDNSYTEGCYKKARDFVQGQAVIIGGVGIAVAFIMVSISFKFLFVAYECGVLYGVSR